MKSTAVPCVSVLVLAAAAAVGCQSTAPSSTASARPAPASQPAATTAAAPAPKHAVELTAAAAHSRPGYTAFEEDGRLWVFKSGSKELAQFEKTGELAKHVVLPGAGPARMTVKAPDRDTALAYLATKPGFTAMAEDGRVWIFREGSKELASVQSGGELAKHVVRPGAGPMRATLRAPDAETIDAWRYSKPGFVTKMENGRLWVFREGSKELGQFEQSGELAKRVVRPGAGPGGVTVKAPDAETVVAYMASQPGFVTMIEDGRMWVFREGCKELEQFRASGELAKHVIRPAAGPNRMTIKAPDAATVDAYLALAE